MTNAAKALIILLLLGVGPGFWLCRTEPRWAFSWNTRFQQAFGRKVKVGVIGIRNSDCDPKRWWQSSDGVREVIDETVAYLYAKLFFHPKT